MIVVVDAGVAAKWILPEQRSDAAAQVLDARFDRFAPDLLRIEVGSALLKAVRRGALDADDAIEALARMVAPTLVFKPVDDLADVALAIANDHGGSMYDATYVALAQSLDAIVLTDDLEMAITARSAGVRVHLLAEGPLPVA